MMRSTPSWSGSGNITPASIRMVVSPHDTAIMFMPNSPTPPSGTTSSRGGVGAGSSALMDALLSPAIGELAMSRDIAGGCSLDEGSAARGRSKEPNLPATRTQTSPAARRDVTTSGDAGHGGPWRYSVPARDLWAGPARRVADGRA